MPEESIFNIENLKEELEQAEWEDDCNNPDMESRQIYIGTVFALYPSGKFYMPWACSNVTEAEAEKDEAWRERAESELEAIGASLESGEGDPCDLFVAQYRDKKEEDEACTA